MFIFVFYPIKAKNNTTRTNSDRHDIEHCGTPQSIIKSYKISDR